MWPLSPLRRATLKQAIKTAIAGVASLYAAKLFKLPEDYWAPISALIVMQSNVGATLSASWTRLAGTAVGAVVGGLFVATWGLNVIAFGAAVVISFCLCAILRIADSQRLATVTVGVLMLIHRPGSAWVVATHRFFEVSIGILVAMVISFVVWPARARETLRKGIADALSSAEAMYQAISRRYRHSASVDLADIRARMDTAVLKNHGLLQFAQYERMAAPEHHELLTLLMDHVDRILEAVAALELATRGSEGDAYLHNFEAELERVETTISIAFEWLVSSIAAWRFDRAWQDLAGPITDLDEKAAAGRKAGATRSLELEEILRFYSLLLGSRNLANELEMAHKVVISRGLFDSAAV